MNEYKNNRYLIKANSHIYFIFLLKNILYLEITKNTKKELITVSSNILNFSAAVDTSGLLHIACIETYGNLIHFTQRKNSFEKRNVTDLNIKSHKVTGLKLYIHKNSIHILLGFTNRFKDTYCNINHYLITNNYWKSNIIAKISADKYIPSYKSDIDKYGNIHLIYKSMDNKKSKLYYRMYNNRYKKWNITRRISNENIDVHNTSILCDTNAIVHVIYSVVHEKNIQTIYLKKETANSLEANWILVEDFPYNASNLTHPFLIQNNNHIKVLWKQNERFYCTQSDITENNWEEMKLVNIDKNDLVPIVYINHPFNDSEKINAPLTYCHYNTKDTFIVGFDEPNEYSNVPELSSDEKDILSAKAMGSGSSRSSIEGLSNYLKNIEAHFEDSNIVFDLIPEIKEISKTNKINSTNEDNLSMKDILKKLAFLHQELSQLKNNELMMLNSFHDIKNDYLELYRKIENILKDFNNLKEQENKNKDKKSLEKIIDMLNDYTFSNKKQKYKG